MFPTEEIQKAVITALSNAGITVYDNVPKSPTFPYVRYLGERIHGNNPKASQYTTVTANLGAFSKYKGFKEIKSLTNDICTAVEQISALENGYSVDRIDIRQVLLENNTAIEQRESYLTIAFHISK